MNMILGVGSGLPGKLAGKLTGGGGHGDKPSSPSKSGNAPQINEEELEAQAEAEEERRRKHQVVEAERERLRQDIRNKYGLQAKEGSESPQTLQLHSPADGRRRSLSPLPDTRRRSSCTPSPKRPSTTLAPKDSSVIGQVNGLFDKAKCGITGVFGQVKTILPPGFPGK